MDTSLSFLPVNPVSPSVPDSTGGPPNTALPAAGGEFSTLLTGQMLKAERQLLAAETLPGTGLQVLPLGNKIKLITSDGPLPDMASLAAFARTQGIDESAVQALFAGQNDSISLTSPGLAASPSFSVAPTGKATPSLHLATPSNSQSKELAAMMTADMLASPRLAASASFSVTPPSTATPSMNLVTPPGTATPSMNLATPSNSQSKELAAMLTADKLGQGNTLWRTPLPVTAAAAADVQTMTAIGALSPMLGSRNLGGWMPLKATALIDASDATNTGEVSSEAAIKDAMRLTITSPAQAVTQRLAQMSGSSEQSTWAALLAGNRPSTGTPPAVTAWETLQLDVPDDLLMGPFDGSQDLAVDNSLASSTNQNAGQPAAGTSAGRSDPAASAPPNLSAQAEQRVLQQQQLADKLGQALAQRLVDQIERGQWKIEMRLRPESLGRIEVELKMHAGGLDALFSAENAVTRELISQGSGKLKDSLTQTGMTVADVSVSGDQNRQSGGNSTPGNSAKPAFGSVGRKPSSVESVPAAVKDEPSGTDGLNVWA